MNAKNNKENGMNVIENKVIECEVTEESRKAYGRPSVNEEKGWKLDHVIPFDFYHNAYIMSRMGIDELVKMVLQECNIKPDDTCSWAKESARLLSIVSSISTRSWMKTRRLRTRRTESYQGSLSATLSNYEPRRIILPISSYLILSRKRRCIIPKKGTGKSSLFQCV